MEPNGCQTIKMELKGSQKGAKVSQETFQNSPCGTEAREKLTPAGQSLKKWWTTCKQISTKWLVSTLVPFTMVRPTSVPWPKVRSASLHRQKRRFVFLSLGKVDSGTCRSYPGKRLKCAEKGCETVSILSARTQVRIMQFSIKIVFALVLFLW